MDALCALSEIFTCLRRLQRASHLNKACTLLTAKLLVLLARRQLRPVRQPPAAAVQGAAWMRALPPASSWASRQRCRAGSLCSRGRCAGRTRLGTQKQCVSGLLSFKHVKHPWHSLTLR